MNLSEEQIERAKKLFVYKKNYYSNYQKENKEKVNERQMNYLKKVYENPEKLKAMRARQKDYYHRVIKPRRELEKAKKKQSENADTFPKGDSGITSPS